MKRARTWTAAAACLIVGLTACPAGAQPAAVATPYEEPAFHQPPPPPSPYVGPAVVNPAWTQDQGGPVGWPGQGGGCREGGCSGFLHRHGMHCWSHHTLPICTSGRAQLDFIFGSCKTFFGEPCLGNRPTVPVPPGYEPFPYGRP